ncbi:hypothetical protein RhoFasB10_03710 [Rhodococcus sp. B10]|nr:hypothetical protein [Rhodococcus sp. B10]
MIVSDVDGCLGRAVEVVELGARELRERCHRRGRQCFATAEDQAQRCTVVGVCPLGEDRQHRRYEVHGRDALARDRPRQVTRIAVTVGLGDDQLGADLERPEEFPHRHVERRRRLLQHVVRRLEVILVLHPQQTVGNRVVRDGDALRAARRPRRVDDVRGVGAGEVGGAVSIRQCSCVAIGDIDQVQRENGGLDGNVDPVTAGRDDADRIRAVDDVRGTIDRMVWVDRYVGTTGFEDGIHSDEQIGRAANSETDVRLGADAQRHEVARKLIRAIVEFAVRDVLVVEHQGDRVRASGDLQIEEAHERRIVTDGGGQWMIGGVPGLEHGGAFGCRQHLEFVQRRRRRLADRSEKAQEPVDEAVDGGRVEQFRRVREVRARSTGFGRRFVDAQLQVELRRPRRDLLEGHCQARQFEVRAFVVLELEQYLEQRRMVGRPCGRHCVYELLERYVGVVERGEIGGTRACEQVGEAHVR